MPLVTEMTDRDILLTLATMAVRDNGMCAHDVLEFLREVGRTDLIDEARELCDPDSIGEFLDDDPEPDDELEADADEG